MPKKIKSRFHHAVVGLLVAGCTVLPTAYASTSPATTTNLTNLGKIAVTTTGLPDPTFSQFEKAYQGSITGTSSWRGFNLQRGRMITVTFKQPVDVTHIQIRTLQNQPLGVYFPRYIDFQFEQNGHWYSAGKRYSSTPETGLKIRTQTYAWTSEGGIEASAIRLDIPISVWVFVDGLSVQGSTTTTGTNQVPLTPVSPKQNDIGPLSPKNPISDGIKNMLLVETGANGKQGLWSEQDFEPMVAYTDTTGKMTSPLFDTMLFLPYGNVSNTATGLTNYISDLFAPSQQLSALDAAVAASNTALNRPGYKEKVVLSIPFFRYGTADFGTVNGQDVNFGGSPTDPYALQAREEAATWYVDKLLAAWKSANFQNLQLVGLYWDEEEYDTTIPGEQSYVQFGTQLAKSNNLPLFWIPYYGAEGDSKWQSLGFSAAWIQPNYVEQGVNADELRISNAMETAKRFGMGIEVELTGLDPTNQQLYNNFLNKLNVEGFGQDQVTHAFYDGSKLLVTAANSTNPNQRAAYDATASFVQGK